MTRAASGQGEAKAGVLIGYQRQRTGLANHARSGLLVFSPQKKYSRFVQVMENHGV